jgi:hypothetical protein
VSAGASWGKVAFVACCTAMASAVVGLGAPGCSSSSHGAVSDGGDETSYYGPLPGDGSADGEGSVGDGGPDGPTCIIPASATFSGPVIGGTAGCSPQVANGQCDSTSFRVKCSAPDPTDVPQPPSSLTCDFLPNNDVSTTAYYCCTCQEGAAASDQ